MKAASGVLPDLHSEALLSKEAKLLVVLNYICIYRSLSVNLGLCFTAH